jgi:hypothetical protein
MHSLRFPAAGNLQALLFPAIARPVRSPLLTGRVVGNKGQRTYARDCQSLGGRGTAQAKRASNSTPNTVVISTLNSIPVANAGPAQNVRTGTTVQLDGSASSDADHDLLTFRWSILASPSGSAAALSNPSIVNPRRETPILPILISPNLLGE